MTYYAVNLFGNIINLLLEGRNRVLG